MHHDRTQSGQTIPVLFCLLPGTLMRLFIENVKVFACFSGATQRRIRASRNGGKETSK
jgi:hypothetical protein